MSRDCDRWNVKVKVLDQTPARMQRGIDRNDPGRSSLFQDLHYAPVAV